MYRRYDEQDQRILDNLASVTASALTKAVKHERTTIRAERDSLTNLANRRCFEEQVQAALKGNRSSDNVGIIFADLDKFKQINDEYGHRVGDEVLIETAKRLLGAVREDDLVARLGGDEFTILLRSLPSQHEATVIVERILKAVREPYRLSNGDVFQTTSSIGVSLTAELKTNDPQTLLRAADSAMYAAKHAGKDGYYIARPLINVESSL